jgi:hypothetical protein
MDHDLMAKEPVANLGFAEQVVGAKEYDYAKEKQGFIAGQHISKQSSWWFQNWLFPPARSP